MKLIMAVIQHEDEDALAQALEEANVCSTRIGSSGGFLRASNVTMMIAVQDEQVESVLGLLKKHCKRRTRHLYTLMPNLEATRTVSRLHSGGGVALPSLSCRWNGWNGSINLAAHENDRK